MEKIEAILKEFNDYEIAVFWKFKLEEYMSGTQKRIKEYIKTNRGIDESQIDALIAAKPEIDKTNESIHCPKCNSKKILKTRVKWIIPAFRVGFQDEMASWKEIETGKATFKDKVECFVCGHVLFDPNNEKRPFFKRVLDIFFDQPLPI